MATKHDEEKLALADIRPKPVLDDITVVIPTLGRDILETCLGWLAGGSAWPGEVIVVDQSSSARVADWIAGLREMGINAKHTPSPQRGRSAGINRGLEQVRTRFVAVTDDDCFADSEWLENMVLRLRESPDSIVTGRVDPAGDNGVEFCVVKSLSPMVYRRPMLKVHPLIGGNMGAAMAIVERVGLFDEHPSVSSAEDSDWGYRALRLCIPIIYEPQIMVRHFNWRDVGQRANRYRQYSRSQGGFYGKYLLSGDLLIVLQMVRDLVRGPVRWLRGVVKQDQDMIDSGRADTLELLPGIVAGLRRGRTT